MNVVVRTASKVARSGSIRGQRAPRAWLRGCGALIASIVFSHCAAAAPLLHELFQDHVVLQRDRAINVWGSAQPDEQLVVAFAGANGQAKADASGHWRVTLPAMKAGGPYKLSVTSQSGATQTVDDVMLGDVWLCSGQSNMVLQVNRALDSRSEILNSSNDSIRLLTVPLVSNAVPQYGFTGAVSWQKAAPSTVPDFSAVCLYFARELQKRDKVAMGLITSAWGGSKIQSWMSEPALRALGNYNDGLDVLALSGSDPAAAAVRWSELWGTWWRDKTKTRPGAEPWSAKPAGDWRAAPAELVAWEQWGVPELAAYNGMLWYRTNVKLTKQQAAQAATLSLGTVDEIDQTWVNGRAAGVVVPGQGRTYRLAANSLHAGDNSIVVNILDTYSAGGLYGPAQNRALRFADGSSLALTGWKYQLPPPNIGAPPRAPWEPVAGLGVIYNSMIAPLTNFGLRGVAWYQGESNTDYEADKYQALLTSFMADWRKQFATPELPFLIVQLANYGAASSAPTESAWAQLREGQRLAVNQDAHAGLAVAIDLGDRYDIHPANKQEVARRLARAAGRVLYGDSAPPSGPTPVSARREDAGIAVTFGDVTGSLVAYSATAPIGFELCGAAPNSCQYAAAQIQNDRVMLTAANAASASRVRYCWADSPVCTLYDEARLPAGPFQIEVR